MTAHTNSDIPHVAHGHTDEAVTQDHVGETDTIVSNPAEIHYNDNSLQL